jgi:hypothetical protein
MYQRKGRKKERRAREKVFKQRRNKNRGENGKGRFCRNGKWKSNFLTIIGVMNNWIIIF